jgi:hypothetical protein
MTGGSVGEKVRVDISGMRARGSSKRFSLPGLSIPIPGLSAGFTIKGHPSTLGTITAVDAASGLITVRLDEPFGGKSTFRVPPERLTSLA